MHDGTREDVYETRNMLKDLRMQTEELIKLQKDHEDTLEDALNKLTVRPKTPPQSEPSPSPSPSPEPIPSPKSQTPEPVAMFEVGKQALARMPEEGNDGWFYL